jgi:hypothetical protein
LAVDTQGLPHAIAITTADVNDRAGAIEALELREKTCSRATVQIAKRDELETFEAMPQRWIVERSLGCLEKCRRLWKNCERHLNTRLQMVHLAFLVLILKRS